MGCILSQALYSKSDRTTTDGYKMTIETLNKGRVDSDDEDNVVQFKAKGATNDNKRPERKPAEGVSLDDFRAYMPMHSYVLMPTGELWPASSINSRFTNVELVDDKGRPLLDNKGKPQTLSASVWLDKHRPVEQMTWAPGLPTIIRDRLISDGGWIGREGFNCFNLYRAPIIKLGDTQQAERWVQHVHRVFPNEAAHIIRWLAFKVQNPGKKVNHALVMGGPQGIGKDTLLDPVKYAVGAWNFTEVSPTQMLGRFNGFVKSVILRISEARDLGDTDRFSFYDHTKVYTAAPPDVLRVDEKHLREHSVFNVCGVIITTNHKSDGIYLPADDRRHFVAWSEITKDDFTEAYWNDLWHWYEDGGNGHVAAYLGTLDLSDFNPKAPPPKTAAFWDIVDANRAPEDAELADTLDAMGNPNAVTLANICTCAASAELQVWLHDRKNRRQIPHRLDSCGYEPVRNDADKHDGQWKIGGKRQTVYAKKTLPLNERLRAAQALAKG
jgi:Family of unknown function (DUF5906)